MHFVGISVTVSHNRSDFGYLSLPFSDQEYHVGGARIGAKHWLVKLSCHRIITRPHTSWKVVLVIVLPDNTGQLCLVVVSHNISEYNAKSGMFLVVEGSSKIWSPVWNKKVYQVFAGHGVPAVSQNYTVRLTTPTIKKFPKAFFSLSLLGNVK